ncbi:MAG: hypothetical protein KDA92_00030 [Planctomycetales bacterium]|nr:hypothetical protein [Planctomycetales bacterium]MCA9166012.1 hypothetical protein [Planctomycetales bacterium]
MKLPTRFTLKSLLLLVALSAVLLAWKALELRRQIARRAIVADIQMAGGHVTFAEDESGKPIDRVRRLYLANTKLEDSILNRLWLLSESPVVSFNSTSFSDAQVHYLDDFDNLTELKLNGTRISPDGIRHLSEKHDITRITLYHTTFKADDQQLLIELFPNAWEIALPGIRPYLR